MTLGQAIIVLLMSVVAVFNYLRYRDVLYPPFIHACAWTGILLLYILYQDLLTPLSPVLYGIILNGLVLFSLGAYLATRGHKVHFTPLRQIDFSPKTWYAAILFWVPLLGLIPTLYISYQLGQQGPFDNFFQNLRYSIITPEDQTGGGAFGLTAYLLPLAFMSVVIQTLFAGYRNDRARYFISVGVMFLYAFNSLGKAFLMTGIVYIAGVLLITRRVSVAKVAAVGCVLFIVIFVLISRLIFETGSGTSFADTMESLGHLFMIYTASALPAFDAYMHSHIDPAWGEHTFRAFYALLARIGFDVEAPQYHLEYEYVPFPTNVYTMYRTYYADFLIWGTLLVPLVLGYLHGYIYKRATLGHLPFIIAYALFLWPVMMQYFADGYLPGLSYWVQCTVYVGLYFYRLRIVPPEPDRPLPAVNPA
jgi:oligosaccharide repeat unit polymerase